MVDSLKEKVKPHYAGNRRKKSVIAHEAVNHDSEKIAPSSVELDAIEKQSEKNTQKQCIFHMTWLCFLISGICGGLIALSLFIGLQWMDLVPSSFVENRDEGEKALQIAETAKGQSEETMKQLRSVLQEIDALKTKLTSFSSQQIETLQNDEELQKESRRDFTILEEKVKALEESTQTFVEISKKIETALSVGQNNASALAVLEQRLETLQEDTAAKKDEKKAINTELFIAISALKNAIERGGSYSDELKLLQQLSPAIDGLDLLQKTATIGLPSATQLAADFAHVADTIVATQNSALSDTGFFKRILIWMKGLIISRPIGNVEGMTLEAIAARMEVAIQAGNYEKALNEWQTLPQNAKDISWDFVHQLETHMAIHQFLQKLLVSVQQESFKETKM
ncbi:hypothetical protein ABID39_000114 [Bartonella japonica]|uniref:Uncharacterized protein n=1 Tax=Bartonella japonica TaxID=357761 RepID=A0ABV2FLK4_9HYPH